MTTIPIEELEAHLREVLARVQAGERVLIASDGQPVAELSPCDSRTALERAFPGMQRATKHMRDIHIEPVPVAPGFDAVAMLIEDREPRTADDR
jgi:prevent-host-death family protein